MIRKIKAVTAALAVGLLAIPGAAHALPDEPLSSAPLIYDANDKLVGPYYAGVTYFKFGDQIYELSVRPDDLALTTSSYMYFAERNCRGEAFYAGTPGSSSALQPSLAPRIVVTENRLFVPNGAPRIVESKSRKFINSPTLKCSNSMATLPMVPMVKKFRGFLGIAFPLRLELPGQGPDSRR